MGWTDQLFELLQLSIRLHEQGFLVLPLSQCDERPVLAPVCEVLLGDFMFTIQHSLYLVSSRRRVRLDRRGGRGRTTYIHSSGTVSACPSGASCLNLRVG